ncbi:hypothetical protein Tco_1157822 [Tanacetum coccineum]
MGKSKDIIVLSSDSEDFNEGPSKGKVPKEDINEGPSKGKLAPLGSSARPRPEVGPELAKLFKYGPPAHLLRWYGYADVDEYLEDPFFDSPEKETKDKSSMDTFLAFGMDTLSLVSEYLKDLEECMDNEDSRVAKEMKLFDALEYKSIVDGQKAWDAELDFTDSMNYVTEKVLDSMGFVHVSISDFSRKMVNYFNVEIHGVKFKADFVVLDYANEGEPSIIVVDLLEEIGSSSEEFVKMGNANRNKGYKELEESKHILEVLENYVIYKKKLDEILIGKERLNKKDFSEEDKINGVVGMVALVDTGESVSVFPYSLYKDLGLSDPRPYQTNLIIADNTQAKAMGEVKNVRI